MSAIKRMTLWFETRARAIRLGNSVAVEARNDAFLFVAKMLRQSAADPRIVQISAAETLVTVAEALEESVHDR